MLVTVLNEREIFFFLKIERHNFRKFHAFFPEGKINLNSDVQTFINFQITNVHAQTHAKRLIILVWTESVPHAAADKGPSTSTTSIEVYS